jgi:intracellular sulfur oxidation DsrE/DsrF family protein
VYLLKIVLIAIFALITLEAKEHKVVFDCSSGNAKYIKSRIWLIGKTMEMFEEKGETISAALTLHGRCVPIVSKAYDEVVADNDKAYIKEAQEMLIKLSKRKNFKVTACSMSLQSNEIDEDDVLSFVAVSDNSFVDTIKYQNDGYALMSFDKP